MGGNDHPINTIQYNTIQYNTRDCYKDPDIVVMSRSRIRWLEHVLRGVKLGLISQAMNKIPRGRILLSRPRLRWKDQVDNDSAQQEDPNQLLLDEI